MFVNAIDLLPQKEPKDIYTKYNGGRVFPKALWMTTIREWLIDDSWEFPAVKWNLQERESLVVLDILLGGMNLAMAKIITDLVL